MAQSLVRPSQRRPEFAKRAHRAAQADVRRAKAAVLTAVPAQQNHAAAPGRAAPAAQSAVVPELVAPAAVSPAVVNLLAVAPREVVRQGALVVADIRPGAIAEQAEVRAEALAESRRAADDLAKENAARNFVAKDNVTDERSARCLLR